MSDKEENILRDSQLASIGKMLAGYTHELKNHLSIINESSGLMGDLLDMGSVDNEQTVQRFKKIISTIGERIVQANTMAKHLNSFAHRMDQPVSVFDVNELLIEELAFLDRFSQLKSISLQKKLQSELPSICNNPSLLQFTLFTIIQETIGRINPGGEIVFSSLVKGRSVLITLDAKNISEPPSKDQEGSSLMAMPITYASKIMGIAIKENLLPEGRLNISITIPSA